MRKTFLLAALLISLFNYAVSISTISTTVGVEPAFQFEVTDPAYMPAYYFDPGSGSYPPDGWSYFWQTDEGAISHAQIPTFHFTTTGPHEVYIMLVPRKKDEDLNIVQAVHSFNVPGGENSPASNGIIHNDPIYFLTPPRTNDKLYVVVPLNSCDVLTAQHSHGILYNDSRLEFSQILSITGLVEGGTWPETNVVLGEVTTQRLIFTKTWPSNREDVAAVVEFNVIANQGEPIVVEHIPDQEFPNQCAEKSNAIDFGFVGPYDPNYKESSISHINVAEVDSSKISPTSVEYTIHFQNIGDGPVDSITVIDSLPNYLTFDSHVSSSLDAAKVDFSVSGNVLTWKLAPIADIKGTNEFPSQAEYKTKGWVKFRAMISPEEDIKYDTCYCLCNRATIFFDSLEPITTKTDIIAIGDQICFRPFNDKPDGPTNAEIICYDSTKFYSNPTASLKDFWKSADYSSISVYPNPTSGLIKFDGVFKGSLDVEVYNIVGILVIDLESHDYTVNISELAAGTYTVKIKDKESTYFARVIRY